MTNFGAWVLAFLLATFATVLTHFLTAGLMSDTALGWVYFAWLVLIWYMLYGRKEDQKWRDRGSNKK